MQNMEAVLAGIRVQKDRAMKDLAYARSQGNPVKVEELQKKVSLIDAQMKELNEQFPKFKEEKRNDPGRKVNFTYTSGATVNEYVDLHQGQNRPSGEMQDPGYEATHDQITDRMNAETASRAVTTAQAGLAGLGLYTLYKIYRDLKNKKNRTPEEEQKMQEVKGKLDAAKQQNFSDTSVKVINIELSDPSKLDSLVANCLKLGAEDVKQDDNNKSNIIVKVLSENYDKVYDGLKARESSDDSIKIK